MSEFEKSQECRDEELIKIVKGFPALWDPRVPLYKKTKTKKRLLWEQVEKLMEGVITAEEASKRWKYLRDCFIRYKRESSIPRKPKDFRFAEIMCFMEESTVSDLSKGYLSGISEDQDELCLNYPMLTSTPNKTDKKIFLHNEENGMHITGMVFDTPSRILFWIDALKEIIAKMHVPLDGEPSNPVILHNLTGNSPRGIALDVCNSRIYWVNSNTTNPSIERSNLDGNDRTIVVKENLYEPLAVAIDHAERKLYWIDDVEGIHFKIERSNLDGSERELLIHNKHQQPVYLAVDNESIYWSDWVYSAVWTMPKNAKAGDYPTKFKSYYDSRRDADPAGIVTRDNVGKIDCATILSMMEKKTNLSGSVPRPLAETFNNLTTSTEESDLITESSRYCLNDGHLNKTDGTCRCKLGFTGPFCEISICHNYCLRGRCIINHRGFPECECTETFSGARCERDVCDDYCLFDGKCSVQNGRPFCSCKYSKGSRCEDPNNIAEVCTIYCASNRSEPPSASVILCRCMDSNQTAERITFSDNFQSSILLPMFAALSAVFLVVIAGLSYYVNKLQRRPRIKRHYVVSKGVMPLTSRPQIPDNQCEITIENCCNMNICGTVSGMSSK